MESKFAFLSSPRFWALVIGAVSLALWQDGIISQSWVTAIGTITGGFIGIRTVDRISDKQVEKAEVLAAPSEEWVLEK